MKSFLLKILLVTAIIFASSSDNFAQTPAGSGPPGPPAGSGPPCWPPPCVPIDGGLTALLIAGAALGGRKIYNLTKEDKIES